MSNIYEKKASEFVGKNVASAVERPKDSEATDLSLQLQCEPQNEESLQRPFKEDDLVESPDEFKSLQLNANQALQVVDDVVLKNYLTRLSELQIVPLEGASSLKDTIIYKINKMVYEKDEYATDKFISIVSSMTYANCGLFMIVDGHKAYTDFYLGIKCNDSRRTASSVSETYMNSIKGQFPGAQISDMSIIQAGSERSEQDHLAHKMIEATTISICSGIPAQKNSKGEYTNATFIQGIEKFAAAMQGKEYTAIILASNVSQQEICDIRLGYENIYTQLSAMSTQQLAYSTNESLANAISRTKGVSDTEGTSHTSGTSQTHSENRSHTDGTSESVTQTEGESHENALAKASRCLSAVGTALGVALTATGVGAPAGVALLGVSAAS